MTDNVGKENYVQYLFILQCNNSTKRTYGRTVLKTKSKNRLSEKVLEVSVSQCIVIQTMVQPSPTF